MDFWDEERKENWAKYQCKSCGGGFILSLPPVFNMLVIFFFLITVPQQEHSRSGVLQTWPTVILNTHKAIQMMKAGSLRHYAASLLQLYYVCRGPLKPSIFIGNVGLYTHAQIFSKCVCWCFVAAKRLSGFPCMLGP